MSILQKLFSVFGAGGSRPQSPLAKPLHLPPELVWNAVKFTASASSYDGEHSYFGGDPKLPDDVTWPERNGLRLDFLFRLDCADLAGLKTSLDLPEEGALLFFYDLRNQPWGEAADAGGWKVLYLPRGSVAEPSTAVGLGLLTQVAARFEEIKTYPDPWSPWVEAIGLTEEQRSALIESDAYNDAGQIGGHPSLIQNAMEIDCELSSRGIGTTSKDYKSPEGRAAEAAACEWRLLLQLPSDKRLGTIFADYGSLYYWIRADDLARRDFSRVWLQLQTS